MIELRKVLAFNMKQHRKRLGLSQAKLAELVDVSDNHIAFIETDRRFPSIVTFSSAAENKKGDNSPHIFRRVNCRLRISVSNLYL